MKGYRIDVDCPNCKIEMEKGHITSKSQDKLMHVTNWYCQKCGHREYSQHNVKF